jgi:integrase
VDLAAGTVLLVPTSWGARRAVKVPRQVRELLLRRHGEKRGPYVFHDKGKQIRTFRGLWLRAARESGQAGLSVHSLRRSFIRNSLDAGLPLKVITTLGGWKTRSLWGYARVTEKALARGLAFLGAFVSRKPRRGGPA